MLLDLVFGAIAFVFAGMAAGACFHLRWAHRLPALPAGPTPGEAARLPERCSVVIAARDEATRIERTVRHLLAQVGVTIDIIVVDDRSTDRTADVLRRLMAEDSRVSMKRVDTLPAGWLGKCHACHVGASAATGDWILFTDADCWLKPDVIARALAVSHRERADHLTLTPGVLPETLGAEAWHLAFLMSLANWISGVNRDRPGAHLGMGAFNLVRADAYRACGGYEALRLTVLDDVRLGLLIARAGRRTRAFLGTGDVECHWGTTMRHMIDVMEKNYFAAIDFNLPLAIVIGIGGPLLWLTAFLAPLSGTLAGAAAGVGMLSLIAPASLIARRLGWGLRGAIAAPFIYPLLFYAVLNSAVKTVARGGVRWRDTFYSLKDLRAGAVR
jgi:glycosyltransferase involved in cell wall biosynthesis